MQTYVIEGTIADIEKKILELPFDPGARMRAVLTRLDDRTQDPQLAGAPRRNGLILFSTERRNQPVTMEFIKGLLDDE